MPRRPTPRCRRRPCTAARPRRASRARCPGAPRSTAARASADPRRPRRPRRCPRRPGHPRTLEAPAPHVEPRGGEPLRRALRVVGREAQVMDALAVLCQAPAERRVRPRRHELDLRSARGHEGRPAHPVVATLELVVADDPLLELAGVEDTQDPGPVLDRAVEVVDEETDVGEGAARHRFNLSIGWARTSYSPSDRPTISFMISLVPP